MKLRCPHCGNTLVPKKDRKHFIVHKCVNPKCPYYIHNLKKVDKEDLKEDYGKNKYKLRIIVIYLINIQLITATTSVHNIQ